jgi:carotenoid cleavage dioxygenase
VETISALPPRPIDEAKRRQAPYPEDSPNQYLIGPYAPVLEEVTVTHLTVEGNIPPELDGRFLRNGPNPIEVEDMELHHWFLGDGMLHGTRLKDGKALWYRNRYVRSGLTAKHMGMEEGVPGPRRSPIDVVNTHVQKFGGKVFALVESGPYPIEIDDELGSVAYSDFGGTLKGPFAAHPHIDFLRNEWHAITYDVGIKDTVWHVVVDANLQVNRCEPIAVSDGPMMHDFALTERYAVLLDLPVVWNDDSWAKGQVFPYEWREGRRSRIGLLPREGDSSSVRWVDVDPCYAFHVANAFDGVDGSVHIDLIVHGKVFDTNRNGPNEGPPALERWTISPDSDRVRRTVLLDRPQEFPRIDERLFGREHRWIYGAGIQGDRGSSYCLDTRNDVLKVHDHGPLRFGSECVFVPRSDSAEEGDGWVLTYVWDARLNTSDLVIIDAKDFDGPAVAKVKLPVRVPFGFHGSWIAE